MSFPPLPLRSRPFRWIVQPNDPPTVGALLQQQGIDPLALQEGRVFCGLKRVGTAQKQIVAGEELQVIGTTYLYPCTIALEVRDDLIAACKPAGLSTLPDHYGHTPTLLSCVAAQMGIPADSLHPTSRLDREVSGVVVFARSKSAILRLLDARTQGRYARRYVALTQSSPSFSSARWDTPIGRARDPRRRQVQGREAQPACTHMTVVARAAPLALLALSPVTGRTHQLRVHAQAAHMPFLGDRLYGGGSRLSLPSGQVFPLHRVALHAASVTVPDSKGRPLCFTAPIPAALQTLWEAVKGIDDAWQEAVTVDVLQKTSMMLDLVQETAFL